MLAWSFEPPLDVCVLVGMKTTKTAIDPLWRSLRPPRPQQNIARHEAFLNTSRRPAAQCTNTPKTTTYRESRRKISYGLPDVSGSSHDIISTPLSSPTFKSPRFSEPVRPTVVTDFWADVPVPNLYIRLSAAAIKGQVKECQYIAEYLLKEKREEPNLQLYTPLIMCNVSIADGSAERVRDLLMEMEVEGIQPDNATCHAVLKVLSIHLDHMLRSDILAYMRRRWHALSEDGAHDVVAGLFRDGLFEQALAKVDGMRRENMRIEVWLLEMAVYILCEAGEIEEAYNIMLARYNSGEPNINRSTWAFLLDKASEACHHPATSLAWTSQVTQDYLNPSSGICLNVLHTASRAGDKTLATSVFSHLSKRGTAFQPIHYELLISSYLSGVDPDLAGALGALTIMSLEKVTPTATETRALVAYLDANPDLLPDALAHLQALHEEHRKIPIAAINLLIECHVHRHELGEAMKIYKILHTLWPENHLGIKSRSFANAETFNLLLKGCRQPVDLESTQFIVSEMRALNVDFDGLTYDRLMIVYLVEAEESGAEDGKIGDEGGSSSRKDLVDKAFEHLIDSLKMEHSPRFGTLHMLGMMLARSMDQRCWDVLQYAVDRSRGVETHARQEHLFRAELERAWADAVVKAEVEADTITI